MKPMLGDVLISGYYGQGNLGDDAILQSILNLLDTNFPEARPVVVSRRSESSRRISRAAWLDATDFEAVAKAVRSSATVLVGGGGLFHDYWPVEPNNLLDSAASDMARQVSLLLLARGQRVPAMIYAVGVGPLRSETSQTMTSLAFRLATQSTVRDEESLSWLKAAGLDPQVMERVRVAADPTFGLNLGIGHALFPNAPEGVKTLLVVPRFWDFGVDPDATVSTLAQALATLTDSKEWIVDLLPFQTSADDELDDGGVCQAIYDRMPEPQERVRIIERPPTWDATAAVFRRADLVLAMRYHAVVLAALAGRPVVGLEYDPKVGSLMSDLGLTDWCIPQEAWNPASVVERLLAAMTDENLAEMAAHVSQMSERAEANLETLNDALGPEPFQDPVIDPLSHQAARLAAHLADVRSESQLAVANLADEIEHMDGLLAAERQARQASVDEVGALRHRLNASEEALQETKTRTNELERSLRKSNEDMAEMESSYQDVIDHLKHDVAVARVERESARADLAVLRSTWGVRLLNRYWAWLSTFVPVGSRRRAVYSRVKSWILSGIRGTQRLEYGGQPPPQTESSPLRTHADGSHAMVGEAFGLGEAFERFRSQLADRSVKGVVCIFSPTQLLLHEGQRSTQLAFELSTAGFAVVHVSFRWHDDGEWSQDLLDSGILKAPLDRVDDIWQRLCQQTEADDRICLTEFPHPSLFGRLALAEGSGWVTVYDIVDDWESFHEVGQAPWYNQAYERHLVATSDIVTAVSARLAEKHAASRRGPIPIVPNGFSPDLAPTSVAGTHPKAAVTLGYFGYMADAWFDWDLVRRVATARRNWRIELVGYGAEGGSLGKGLPPNVDVLGRQPRQNLASIAANWDVGIIPFRAGPVAEAADPIKTYEYFGLGLPVVATGVSSPPGASAWCFSAASLESFITLVEQAVALKGSGCTAMIGYALENTWKARLDALLDLLQQPAPELGRKRALFEASK